MTKTIDIKEISITEPQQDSEPEPAESTGETTLDELTHPEPSAPRRLSIRVSTMVTAAVIAVLTSAVAVLGFLLIQEHGKVADRAAADADGRHAEQVATDYALGAATINYQDFPAWVAKLKANTAPALANKFDASAPKLEQILVPLKWTSTATPIAAKVQSVDGSIYKLDVFVTVDSTTAQTPDGAQTTVTYNITVDKRSGWKITDVGGTTAALPGK